MIVIIGGGGAPPIYKRAAGIGHIFQLVYM